MWATGEEMKPGVGAPQIVAGNESIQTNAEERSTSLIVKVARVALNVLVL